MLPVLTFMAGIVLAEQVGAPGFNLSVAILGAGALLLLLARQVYARQPRLLLAAVCVCAVAAGVARHQAFAQRPADHIARLLAATPTLTRVAGTVLSPPVARGATRNNPFLPRDVEPTTQTVIAVEQLLTTDPPTSMRGNIRVTVAAPQLDWQPGDHVVLTGRLDRPRRRGNPGEPDWQQWYRYEDIHATLFVPDPALMQHAPAPQSWRGLLQHWRTTVRRLVLETYTQAPSDSAARLLDVLVLGQRSAADRALNDAFRRAGSLHFLAVSGFNVAILAYAVWLLARYLLRAPERWAGLLAIAATLGYALAAEPNAPVLRAAIVVVVATVARLLHRPAAPLNWLALAALLVLLANPFELFRAGFQLSFLLVAALILGVPTLERLLRRPSADDEPPREARTLRELLWRKARTGLGGLVLVSLFAWLVSLPLTLWHFQQLTPWGPLGSLLLTVPVAATMVLSLLQVLFGWLPLPGDPLGWALRSAAHLTLAGTHLFDRLPGTIIDCPAPPAILVFGTYLAAVVFLCWRRTADAGSPQTGHAALLPVAPRRLVQAAVAASVLLTWLGWFTLRGAPTARAVELHVLSVGDGAATLLAAPGVTTTLACDIGTIQNLDAGEIAAVALRALHLPPRVRALISHANFDHYSGLPTLAARGQLDAWSTGPTFLSQVQAGHAPPLLAALPRRLRSPGVLYLGDAFDHGDAHVDVLWPPANIAPDWPANETSLVLRVTAHGRRLLLTGDIEAQALRALLARHAAGVTDLQSDVLIAPHHGAVVPARTAELLRSVSPYVLIVSAGEAEPPIVPLARDLLGTECQVCVTRTAGAVAVRVTADGALTVTPGIPGAAAVELPPLPAASTD